MISVHAKQRQIHKNFAALRDKGLSVIQFADTLHVTRKFILEVLAHSWWLCVHSFIPWTVLLSGMATTVFFGDAVCCVHLWSKSSSPKISRALLFLFSCSFINKRTASNYQFSFFFGETVCCVHLFSRKVINQVE